MSLIFSVQKEGRFPPHRCVTKS